jgi:hypothetical protein
MIDKLLLDRWMGDLWPEDYIAWAVDLLVAGRDTPSLRILAGLNPTHERGDIEGYFLRSCKELGLELLELSDNPRDAVRFVKRLYQSSAFSPEETVHRMANLCQRSDYSDPLLEAWFALDDALVYGPPLFLRLPEEMESLEETIDREWVLFDRAVTLDIPDGFQRFVRCNTCQHIGPRARPSFFRSLCVLLTQGYIAADTQPSECAKCGSSGLMHMACAEVREDYFSRLRGGGESP